jgi:mRNA interferase MazF
MTPSRGEVWPVNLDPTIADEIRKIRPAIVVSRDAIGTLALRAIVPVTAWQDRFQSSNWLIRLDPDQANGLEKTSAADTFQIRSVSTRRFMRRIGMLTAGDLDRVATGLRAVLVL